MNKNINLEEALEQNNYADVSVYISESINQLKTFLYKQEITALEDEIEKKKAGYSFLVKKELVKKNVHFLFGRYIGFVDSLYEQLFKAYKEKAFRDSLESLDISDIPHVNDIIVTIRQEEGIRHGNLAEKVGIEKSTLSGIMEKLVAKGAVRFSRPGKYKYYYLTELGNKYYENNRRIIEAETNIEALTEQLLIVLSKEKDANGKLLQIIKALCEGKSVFKGYNAKTNEKLNPSIIFAGIPTIKQLNVFFSDTSIHTVDNGCVLTTNSEKSVIYLSDENNNDFVRYPELSMANLLNI